MTDYDSELHVLRHMQIVQTLMIIFAQKIIKNATQHDKSKLTRQEKAFFDEHKPLLDSLDPTTDDYRQALENFKYGLSLHYANNRHHPEHHENGVADMDLLDLIEMLADWYAASIHKNHHFNGLQDSIDYCTKRFNISPDIERLLTNTAKNLGWLNGESVIRVNGDSQVITSIDGYVIQVAGVESG